MTDVNMDARPGLPEKSNKPSSQQGYKAAHAFITSLLESPVARKAKGSPTNIRCLTESVFRKRNSRYISKGDVFSVLTDLGYQLHPTDNHYADFAGKKHFSFDDGFWDYACNHSREFSQKKLDSFCALFDRAHQRLEALEANGN